MARLDVTGRVRRRWSRYLPGDAAARLAWHFAHTGDLRAFAACAEPLFLGPARYRDDLLTAVFELYARHLAAKHRQLTRAARALVTPGQYFPRTPGAPGASATPSMPPPSSRPPMSQGGLRRVASFQLMSQQSIGGMLSHQPSIAGSTATAAPFQRVHMLVTTLLNAFPRRALHIWTTASLISLASMPPSLTNAGIASAPQTPRGPGGIFSPFSQLATPGPESVVGGNPLAGGESGHEQLYGSLGHRLGSRSGGETASLRWIWAICAARMWMDAVYSRPTGPSQIGMTPGTGFARRHHGGNRNGDDDDDDSDDDDSDSGGATRKRRNQSHAANPNPYATSHAAFSQRSQPATQMSQMSTARGFRSGGAARGFKLECRKSAYQAIQLANGALSITATGAASNITNNVNGNIGGGNPAAALQQGNNSDDEMSSMHSEGSADFRPGTKRRGKQRLGRFVVNRKQQLSAVHDRHSIPLDVMAGTRAAWSVLAAASDGAEDDLDTVDKLHARLRECPADLDAREWYLILASQNRIGQIKINRPNARNPAADIRFVAKQTRAMLRPGVDPANAAAHDIAWRILRDTVVFPWAGPSAVHPKVVDRSRQRGGILFGREELLGVLADALEVEPGRRDLWCRLADILGNDAMPRSGNDSQNDSQRGNDSHQNESQNGSQAPVVIPQWPQRRPVWMALHFGPMRAGAGREHPDIVRAKVTVGRALGIAVSIRQA